MKKKNIIISFIAIAALVTAFAIISRHSKEEAEESTPLLRLNDTLTNAMSDIAFVKVSLSLSSGAFSSAASREQREIMANAVTRAAIAIHDMMMCLFFIDYILPAFLAKSMMKSAVPSIPRIEESMHRS